MILNNSIDILGTRLSLLFFISSIAAFISFLGWLFLYFLNVDGYIDYLFVMPLMYLALSLFGDKEQFLEDKKEIMGGLAAFTYLSSFMSTVLALIFLYDNDYIGLFEKTGILMIAVGSSIVSLRFYLNTFLFLK